MSWVTRLLKDKPIKAQRRRGEAGYTPPKPYQAVTIHCTALRRCGAAADIEGQIYLAKAAPSLPLADCANPSACSCRYHYHEDRRLDVRRDVDAGLPDHGTSQGERRARRERRVRRASTC